MYLLINIIGLFVFLAIGVLFSKKRKEIQWKSIIIMVALNLLMAWFLTSFDVGRAIVSGAAEGFNWLVQVAYVGIEFALPSWVHVKSMDFVTSALLPILLIVPLFDILTYIGVLPFIIKWIGKGLSFITGQPKFESFFAVEMMFLGNTEALAVSSLQLKKMKPERDVTLAMMSMSCVTASIIGAYIQMMPGRFILTAIPINIINAIIVTSLLNPVKVDAVEDTVATISNDDEGKKEPFFSFLGDSILGAGKLILIITANVIAFVALAALIDKVLQLVNPWLTLEHILGIIMYPFAWLLGLNSHDSFQMAQYMGTKLVTNEFVVMGKVTDIINKFDPHFKAVLTVFITSFANFSTLGMIIGCFKGLVDKGKNDIISKNVGYMLLSGILVSLLSAAFVGLFVW
ncbi:NupC/NupG family nucleoside CNT transporter [Companilactobacillus mishanensis]|uniref:NupC/NupG family nucleoside CNT transporter n=1 Tax=Companilactobacillus mishanensis TaxID=2486008 RepID=A0A5P0ZFE0_9LACO|nr:nucleoside transporter C-terminal domain-containing protein [Companilactobacillus mishanensis]MQS44126.1 NupC/NupG family nucleoside CNT transporter [Companilactobacillus mishanensis]MQS51764.1 NupC/NupG family nucleoside CNT transporter [Companilactobacillus mishanensis]MQS88425.1 NupC/NupG family nucleoside CNT transporter [Companilactobacillus mishanensis]